MKNHTRKYSPTGRRNTTQPEKQYVSPAPIPEKETATLSASQEEEILLEDFADQYWATANANKS
jgi:hypothetical protein